MQHLSRSIGRVLPHLPEPGFAQRPEQQEDESADEHRCATPAAVLNAHPVPSDREAAERALAHIGGGPTRSVRPGSAYHWCGGGGGTCGQASPSLSRARGI